LQRGVPRHGNVVLLRQCGSSTQDVVLDARYRDGDLKNEIEKEGYAWRDNAAVPCNERPVCVSPLRPVPRAEEAEN
jgi:hypothetical protein